MVYVLLFLIPIFFLLWQQTQSSATPAAMGAVDGLDRSMMSQIPEQQTETHWDLVIHAFWVLRDSVHTLQKFCLFSVELRNKRLATRH